MRRILDTRTNTIHKPRDETSREATACGSLMHVPHEYTAAVSAENLRSDAALDRCGGCFEDAGGY